VQAAEIKFLRRI